MLKILTAIPQETPFWQEHPGAQSCSLFPAGWLPSWGEEMRGKRPTLGPVFMLWSGGWWFSGSLGSDLDLFRWPLAGEIKEEADLPGTLPSLWVSRTDLINVSVD